MKAIFSLTGLIFLMVLSLPADSLTELSSALRMQAPFALSSGKPGADYYVRAGRASEAEAKGQIRLPIPLGTERDKPLQVWVRVWWESTGRNEFRLDEGEQGIAIAGTGFSEGWEWIQAPRSVTLTRDRRDFTISYGEGVFSLDRILFTADEAAVPEGKVIATGPRRAEIYFNDDFMRQKEAGRENVGKWQTISGSWRQYMISDVRNGRKSSEATKSANAFALKGTSTGKKAAMTINGLSAWRNYRVSGSLMVSGSGTAGIVFNYQDDKNYLLFEVGTAPAHRTRLIRVYEGVEEILAESDLQIEDGNYYSICAEAVNGAIRCCLDDRTIFSIEDSGILGGRIGLACLSDGYAVFDDIMAVSARVLKEDFEDWQYGHWDKLSGEWWVKWPRGSAGLFASLGAAIDPGAAGDSAAIVGRGSAQALIAIGTLEWDKYAATARVLDLKVGETAGLLFALQDKDNYWVYTATPQRGRDYKINGVILTAAQVKAGEAAVREEVRVPFNGQAFQMGIKLDPPMVVCSINGQSALKVLDPDLGSGRFGLTADSREGVSLDDVVIDFEKKKEPDAWHFVVPKFTEENSMKNWARESSDWVKKENDLFANIKDIFGDLSLELRLSQLDKPHELQIKNDVDKSNGYRLTAARTGPKGFKFDLYREGVSVLTREITRDIPAQVWKIDDEDENSGVALALVKEGHYISGQFAGETVIEYRDEAPIEKGRRTAIRAPGVSRLDNVHVQSPNLLNYLFTLSPVDWYQRDGEWRITNRWKCDPRWSWYGGRGTGRAALWNKRELEGDFTLDLFMSMQMDSTGQPHYFHPGNMNISVCADGENLGSGYSFIFGGDRGIMTQIRRGSEVVAETREKLFLPPSTRDGWQPMEGEGGLHRRWFHFTIVRRGNLFEYYLDNKRMCTFEDKAPLTGKRFGIWTYDNGIMVARIRVSAENVSERLTPLQKFTAAEKIPEGPAYPVFLESDTHPLGETPLERRDWIIRENKRDAVKKVYTAAVDLADFKGRKDCLAVRNRMSGGKFSLKLFEGDQAPAQLAHMNFDYLLPDETAKVDFFLRTSLGWYYVRFSGDTDPFRPGKPPFYPMRLGMIDVQADGDWHSVRLDLFNLLKHGLAPKQFDSLRIKGVYLGYGSYGYTDAGLSGNFRGRGYYLDKVHFETPGGREFRVKWKNNKTAYSRYAFSMDQKPDTVPNREDAVAADMYEAGNLAAGEHYFHLAAVDAENKLSPVMHYRFKVDRNPPVVKAAALAGDWAEFTLEDDGAGIDWESLNILAGKTKFEFGHPAFGLKGGTDTARLNLPEAGLSLEEGDLPLSVISVRDRAGNKLRDTFSSKNKFSRAADKEPPVLKFVLPEFMQADKHRFEVSADLWQSQIGNKGKAVLDLNHAYTGRSSMALIHNDFATNYQFARSKTFNAAEMPLITFAYRLQPDTRVNLSFNSVQGRYNIGLADRNSDDRTVARIKDVKQDLTWQRAEINLRKLLLAKVDTVSSLDIRGLYFEDIGWRAADPMTKLWIDDFFLHKFYDNSKGTLKLWVSAADLSGLASLSHRWVPFDQPDSKAAWTEQKNPRPDKTGFFPFPVPKKQEGIFRLQVKAVDRAGNASAVRDFPVLTDNTRPRLTGITPAPFMRTAASTISIGVKDMFAGIRRKSLVLNVNNKKYSLASPELSYSEKTQQLIFDCSRSAGTKTFPDQKKVQIGIFAEDGLRHAEKKSWYWTMDYTRDKTPPPAPFVTRLPYTAQFDSFETTKGDWRDRSGGRGGRVALNRSDSALGKVCLTVTNRSSGGTHDCFVRQKAFDGLDYNMISFDYKMAENVHVDFLLLVDGTWYSIKFGAENNAYKRIGEVPCIRDGKWHHAEIALGPMLAKAFPGRKTVTVRNLLMGEWDAGRNNPGNSIYSIDNFALFRMRDYKAYRFSWTSVYDPTGIQSYRVALSADPKAVPAQDVGRRSIMEMPSPGPGTWYFQLSARDGNGNISEPASFGPIVVK